MNNWALDLKIDMPLHIVFKSGGLLVNMLMGWIFMGKQYTMDQTISVVLVTLGVLLSTYTTASGVKKAPVVEVSLTSWLTGIALLSFALLLSSVLGLYQENTYRKYGKQWREGLFYTHFLALPLFIFVSGDIWAQAVSISRSSVISLREVLCRMYICPLGSLFPSFLAVPRLWIYVLLNGITQYVCISGVHQLTSVATSLTVNLVLTSRKFVSLLISVYFFSNRFELGHYFGTALVFLGTFWYSVATTRKFSSSTRQRKQSESKLSTS